MAANSKQKLKLLYLHNMLEELTDATHGLSMAQIIENLESKGVSAERKGIYRDLNILREFGCEITTLQRSPVEYTMVKSGLDLSELMMLVDAVQSSKFLTKQNADRLSKKLGDLASVYERDALRGRVHVDGRVKNQRDSLFHSVDTIHKAMRAKRKVRFMYFKYDVHMEQQPQNEGRPYVMTPVHVVFHDGNYYLVAWNDHYEKFNHFRIDRMRLVQVDDLPATRNQTIANYDMGEFVYRVFSMYDGKPIRVKLLVAATAMDVVVDRFGTDLPVKVLKDGSAEVHVTVISSQQFFGWIAGTNGDIRIVGPNALVEEYRQWLKDLLKNA